MKEEKETKLKAKLEEMENILQEKGMQPVFFIGSGLSMRYLNSPNWEGLLKEIAKEVDADYEKLVKICNGGYEEIAQELEYYYFRKIDKENIEKGRRETFRRFIAKIFISYIAKYKRRNPIDKIREANEEVNDLLTEISNLDVSENEIQLKKIVESFDKVDKRTKEHLNNLKKIKEVTELQKIHPKAIITTNYDTLLEDVIFCNKCRKYIGQESFSYDFSETEEKINLYKIHGCVEKPESIIITKEDYDNFFKKSRYLYSKILTLFWEYPVMFIGYSVSDRNIRDILTLIIDIMTEEQKVDFLKHIWFVDFVNHEDEECVTDKEIELLNGKSIKVPCFSLNYYFKFYEAINRVVLNQKFGKLDFTISKNVIELLIEPLYQQQDKLKVVVRELLQNALDACKAKHVSAKISIKICENDEDTYLEIQDNGIGMNLQEIKENFLTVGKTNKKNNCEGLVGKYGIGILSIFLIGNRAEVYTKKENGELLSFEIYMKDNKKQVQWVNEKRSEMDGIESFTIIKIYFSENTKNETISLKTLGLEPYVTKTENSIIVDNMGKESEILKIKKDDRFLYDSEELKIYSLEYSNEENAVERESCLKNMKGLILYNDLISSVVYEKEGYNQLNHIDIPFVILDVKKMDEIEVDVKTSLSRNVLQISGEIMEKISKEIYRFEIKKVIEVIQNSRRDLEKGETDKFELLKNIKNSSIIMEKDVDIIIFDKKLFCSSVDIWSHIKICAKEKTAKKFYEHFSERPVLIGNEYMNKSDISDIIEAKRLIGISEKYLEDYLLNATNQHNGLRKQALIDILGFLGESKIRGDMWIKDIWDNIKEDKNILREKFHAKASNGILWLNKEYENNEIEANDDYFIIYDSEEISRHLDCVFSKILKEFINENSVEEIFGIHEE